MYIVGTTNPKTTVHRQVAGDSSQNTVLIFTLNKKDTRQARLTNAASRQQPHIAAFHTMYIQLHMYVCMCVHWWSKTQYTS